MAIDPERAELPGPDEMWTCERCGVVVRAGEDCPECGPIPCGECRLVECECDTLADNRSA